MSDSSCCLMLLLTFAHLFVDQRLGSVTGEELESLELDATANGAPWYNSDDDQHEDAPYISNNNNNNSNNNVIHHNEAMSGSQFLPFLTAFASTGQVVFSSVPF